MNRISNIVFATMLSLLFGSLPEAARAEDAAKAKSVAYDTQRGVVYAKRGDFELKADLYIPQTEGPHPGVVVVHGGGWTSGKRNQLAGFSRALARSGFTAVAISYRLAPKHVFPAQIEDCKTAVRWMRDNAEKYKIDPKRIGGAGYSAGGHLVALLGTTDEKDGLEGPDGKTSTQSSRIQAYVAGGAPCDFRKWPGDHVLSFWLGTSRDKQPESYLRASPIHFVTKDDPPAFFFHGEKDGLVPIINSRSMVSELKKAGITASLFEVKDAGHLRALFSREASRSAIEFLSEQLLEDKPAKEAVREKEKT